MKIGAPALLPLVAVALLLVPAARAADQPATADPGAEGAALWAQRVQSFAALAIVARWYWWAAAGRIFCL